MDVGAWAEGWVRALIDWSRWSATGKGGSAEKIAQIAPNFSESKNLSRQNVQFNMYSYVLFFSPLDGSAVIVFVKIWSHIHKKLGSGKQLFLGPILSNSKSKFQEKTFFDFGEVWWEKKLHRYVPIYKFLGCFWSFG